MNRPMPGSGLSRRNIVKGLGALTGGALLSQTLGCRPGAADYTLTIAVKPVELAPGKVISTTTYNGQFPGPLLRFKEGQSVTIQINNETKTPEQLHWHGQFLSTDVIATVLS